MSKDFGYINARVRGMKSKLLGGEFFLEAANATNFEAFSNTLSQSPYMRELEEAQARFSGLKAIDAALGQNFYRTTQSILSFSDGTANAMIGLLLMRFDLLNLKAIARAKHSGRSLEEIQEVLLPAGRLKPAVLDSIAGANDLNAVVQALGATGHPLARAFRKGLQRYGSENDLYGLEVTLDNSYYKVLLDEIDKLALSSDLKKHIQREIDATNLRTALKLRGATETDDELFVSGGKEISRQLFSTIIADTSAAALGGLNGTRFAAVADSVSLSESENAIRAVLDVSARRLAQRGPLGFGVVLNYLRLKEAEAAKLRLLARGKYYNVPADALAKELGHG